MSTIPSLALSNAALEESSLLPRSFALVGNPNSGKTTLFNALTGLRYKVANYPGVTVEKRHGFLADEGAPHHSIRVVDLPGIYSLTALSLDEKISLDFLKGSLAGEARPSGVICVVDASNLERNLYLVSQVLDLGIPTIIALNMCDLAAKRGVKVYGELLARELGVPVLSLSATANPSVAQFKKELLQFCTQLPSPPTPLQWRRKFPYEDGDDASEAAARYAWIRAIVAASTKKINSPSQSRLEAIDRMLLHPVIGIAVFLATMLFLFQALFVFASYPMDAIDAGLSAVTQLINPLLPDGLLKSLLIDGILAGVGSVLVFVPQIAMLFFLLTLLEDTGYLARAAFLMDTVMRKVGLQGRAFIPLLSSFTCAIPGILSTRTIPSVGDRMITILVAPLMSCSARLPVFSVLIGAAVPAVLIGGVISLQGMVLLGMYLLGILGAALVAWCLRLTTFRGQPSLFVMEMPTFRLPSVKLALTVAVERATVFVKDAGTVILACSIVLWFLASFPRGVPLEQSYAGRVGKKIEPVIAPLGYNWEIGVGLLSSFAAREVFVSSLSTVYHLSDKEDEESASSLITLLKNKVSSKEMSIATIVSLMIFYVFACQCISTLAITRRETNSWRWPLFMLSYMSVLAYSAAWIGYRLTLLFME